MPGIAVSGIGSTIVGDDFHDLAVGHDRSAHDAEEGQADGEYASDPHPLIEPAADQKTADDAPGHGEAQLHDDGYVFGPGFVFFIVEK